MLINLPSVYNGNTLEPAGDLGAPRSRSVCKMRWSPILPSIPKGLRDPQGHGGGAGGGEGEGESRGRTSLREPNRQHLEVFTVNPETRPWPTKQQRDNLNTTGQPPSCMPQRMTNNHKITFLATL